ncbi:MAG: hypothetical protein ACYTEK_26955, partial [Planctomycetota bacterium]
MSTPTRPKILVIASVVFSILVRSVSLAAQPAQLTAGQPQPESAPTVREGQDANSVNSAAPVPQGAPAADAAAQLTVEKLEDKKKQQIAESQELSDEVKAKIAEAYDKAIAQLKSAAEFEANRQEYSQARKDAPGTLAKTRELLAQEAPAAAPGVAADTTMAQADQALTT